MSEESEDEVVGGESLEEINYRRKYQMLLERCEVLQQDNERLINRIQHVYKYTRQIRKERHFLVDRLEGYNDNWRLGINQYLLDSLSQPVKPKSTGDKSFRRPSTVKKTRKTKEGKAAKKISKEKRISTETIKHEFDPSIF